MGKVAEFNRLMKSMVLFPRTIYKKYFNEESPLSDLYVYAINTEWFLFDVRLANTPKLQTFISDLGYGCSG